jgi:hypothetical protein
MGWGRQGDLLINVFWTHRERPVSVHSDGGALIVGLAREGRWLRRRATVQAQ